MGDTRLEVRLVAGPLRAAESVRTDLNPPAEIVTSREAAVMESLDFGDFHLVGTMVATLLVMGLDRLVMESLGFENFRLVGRTVDYHPGTGSPGRILPKVVAHFPDLQGHLVKEIPSPVRVVLPRGQQTLLVKEIQHLLMAFCLAAPF